MKYVIIGIIPDVQIRVNIQEFVTSHSFTFYFQGNFTDSQRNAIYMFGMIWELFLSMYIWTLVLRQRNCGTLTEGINFFSCFLIF